MAPKPQPAFRPVAISIQNADVDVGTVEVGRVVGGDQGQLDPGILFNEGIEARDDPEGQESRDAVDRQFTAGGGPLHQRCRRGDSAESLCHRWQ